MENISFNAGSVPVSVAAKAFGKDRSWVRAGIISGWLPIGYATRDGERITKLDDTRGYHKGRINYYISPRKLYEETGYLYRKDCADGD